MNKQEIRKCFMRYINSKKSVVRLKFPISNKLSETKRQELLELLQVDMYKNFYSIENLEIKKRKLSLFMDRILFIPFLISGTWFCLPKSYLSKYNIYIHITAIKLNPQSSYTEKRKPSQSVSLEIEKKSLPVPPLEYLEYSLRFQKFFQDQPWYIESQRLDYKKELLVPTRIQTCI